ncbi:MAG TPA: phenylalanine--tRNA ligase subunit alpha [bacterium]|nr:phenylalanine--tRNA ligase subunit alpha [bacterium]
MDDLDRIVREAEAAIRAAGTEAALEEVRRTYLGRRGLLADLFDQLPQMPPAERPEWGRRLNAVRLRIETLLEARLAEVRAAASEARLAAEAIDVTLPGRRPLLGRRHLLRQTLDEVERIFLGLGFEIVEGTEIETDEFNFERLNMDRDHPARDAQDSFYITDDLLLRTHTTVVDARVMVGRTPPMRVLTTGRCYRRDAMDWKHMPVFHQVDGFMVGERVTMADLKGILTSFARQLFGPQTRTQFVPGYFPFTEPSAEMLVHFNDQWMELGGCGMFHPRVLEMAGIDPARYTALAFGLGVDRQVMVRYGIPDIRLFWDNDLRLLRQF